MNWLRKKFATAKRLYDAQGLKGISSSLERKKADFDQWLHSTEQYKWGLGRFVELRGNKVFIEKMSFNVNNPAISTKMKSHFLFDKYEKFERTAIKRFLRVDLPVVELGGAIGVVACYANKMLRDPQRHLVIEANPDLLPLLEENRDRNNCHYTVLHRAVAYGSDEITFHLDDEFWTSNANTSTGRSVKVPTISLRKVFEQFGFERCTLICDIEGGEVDMVRHEAELIKQRVATFIVEVHDWWLPAEIVDDMLRTLKRMGFVSVFQESSSYVLHNTGFYPLEV